MRVRFSLRPPKIMQVNKITNLLELFYEQYKRQNKENFFLQSLKEPKKKYSWEEVYINIIKFSFIQAFLSALLSVGLGLATAWLQIYFSFIGKRFLRLLTFLK